MMNYKEVTFERFILTIPWTPGLSTAPPNNFLQFEFLEFKSELSPFIASSTLFSSHFFILCWTKCHYFLLSFNHFLYSWFETLFLLQPIFLLSPHSSTTLFSSFSTQYIHFNSESLFYLYDIQLQIQGYNSDLYRNSSEASKKPNGLVSIALLIQVRHFLH